MSEGFSEHHCKKKYKSRRRNIPVVRLLLFGILLFLFIKLGLVEKVVNLLPLPGNSETVEVTWDSRCRDLHGRAFELKNGLGQCSWVLSDSVFYLPNSFLRYLSQTTRSSRPRLHWVAPRDNFSEATLVQVEDSVVTTYLHVLGADSLLYWVNMEDGCRFPGLCPKQPLDWSALPITEDFDFEGQESLLAMDALLGIGEAPVHPILPGVVLAAGKDSMGNFIELDHGNNVVSKMSGMYPSKVSDSLKVGDSVDVATTVGRLAPRDSSTFFLSVRRNGLFVRWKDFYSEAHPLEKAEIARFVKDIDF